MRLNHVTISVTDLERSVAFYENLGLKQIVANYHTTPASSARTATARFSLHWLGPEVRSLPSQTTSIHFECEALDERVSELKSNGNAFEQDPLDQPYLWREAILEDPDGNVIFLFNAGENRLNPPWRLPDADA